MRFTFLLAIVSIVCIGLLVAGCVTPPTTQPTPPSEIERQILLAAETTAMIAVDAGLLPITDAVLIRNAYNDAIKLCDEWDAGTLTAAVALSEISQDILTLTNANAKAAVALQAKIKAMKT